MTMTVGWTFTWLIAVTVTSTIRTRHSVTPCIETIAMAPLPTSQKRRASSAVAMEWGLLLAITMATVFRMSTSPSTDTISSTTIMVTAPSPMSPRRLVWPRRAGLRALYGSTVITMDGWTFSYVALLISTKERTSSAAIM